MRIVGICGSLRTDNADFMMKTLLEEAENNGADVGYIVLRTINIDFVAEGASDEFHKALPKILDADVLVFASPCYYDMITPQLLNMIYRLDPYADDLKKKKAVIIVSAKEEFKSYGKDAVRYLKRVCRLYDFEFIGSVVGRAGPLGGRSKDSKMIADLKALGKIITGN